MPLQNHPTPPPHSRLLRQAAAALCALPLASSLALATGMTADADTDSDESNQYMFTLGTVAVYGQRPTAAEEAESSVERETITLLEKKDVGTALALVPGVLYNRPQGSRYESSVVVRGYSLRDMPIFVDGIPVYIPYNGFSDLGRFTTADTASIQVAKGYSSVMYGHNTRGGAINVVSLRPRSTLDANATLGAATGDVREFSSNIGTRQEQWYLQTGVSYLERGYTRLADHFVGTDARGREVDSDRYVIRPMTRMNIPSAFRCKKRSKWPAIARAEQVSRRPPGNGPRGIAKHFRSCPIPALADILI